MRKRRAIVFDNEPLIVNMLKLYLTSLDYEVLTFTDPDVCPIYGRSSEACKKNHACADVILSDFQMSRMNGIQLMEAQTKNGCKLTVKNKALMSGNIDEADREKIALLGCAFFDKPVDFAELSSWLRACDQRIDVSQPLAARRRKRNRLSDNREIAYRANENDEILTGTAVDISDFGLRLKISSPLVTGQLIDIDTKLPNDCRRGLVIWTMCTGDGSHLAGLIRSEAADAATSAQGLPS